MPFGRAAASITRWYAKYWPLRTGRMLCSVRTGPAWSLSEVAWRSRRRLACRRSHRERPFCGVLCGWRFAQTPLR